MDIMGQINTPDVQIYSDATHLDIKIQLKTETWM